MLLVVGNRNCNGNIIYPIQQLSIFCRVPLFFFRLGPDCVHKKSQEKQQSHQHKHRGKRDRYYHLRCGATAMLLCTTISQCSYDSCICMIIYNNDNHEQRTMGLTICKLNGCQKLISNCACMWLKKKKCMHSPS